MRIRDRPKAGAWLGFALSVLFAGIMVPLTTFDLWSGPAVDAAGHAVFTVRLPETSLWHDTLVGTRIEHRRIVVARGEKVDAGDKRLIDAYESRAAAAVAGPAARARHRLLHARACC